MHDDFFLPPYMPPEQRLKVKKLRERAARAPTVTDKVEIYKEIDDVRRTHEKPLSDCTMDELVEFRSYYLVNGHNNPAQAFILGVIDDLILRMSRDIKREKEKSNGEEPSRKKGRDRKTIWSID